MNNPNSSEESTASFELQSHKSPRNKPIFHNLHQQYKLHCTLLEYQKHRQVNYHLLHYLLILEGYDILQVKTIKSIRYIQNHTHWIFWMPADIAQYSLRPKLSTKSYFIKQKCQLQIGVTQNKNAAMPLSTSDTVIRLEWFNSNSNLALTRFLFPPKYCSAKSDTMI